MFKWSLISINSPGRSAASRLPAALVCTSTVTPLAASVAIAPFIADASPLS